MKIPLLPTLSKLFDREDLNDDEDAANPQSKIVETRLGDLFVYLQNVPFAEKRDVCSFSCFLFYFF